MIEAVKEDYFLFVGVCARGKDSALCCVVAVFCKERPVGCVNGVNKKLCALNHNLVGRGGAVAELHLLHGGGVNVGVAIAENVRAVGAHIVDIFVAVNIPEVCALRLFGEARPSVYGDKLTFGGAEVAVNACGDNLCSSFVPLVGFCVFV